MGKVVLYIAQSLDGYIARENGDIDWLRDDRDYGYDFINTIDTVILGRKTYKQLFQLTEEFPYQSKDVYVVSETIDGHDDYATFVQPEQITPLINVLRRDQNSMLFKEIIRMGLIDEYHIALQPTLIGSGILLFNSNEQQEKLDLIDCQRFDDGMLMLTYRGKEKEREN